MQVDDCAEANRREVNPPIEVESATWSAGGQLDWWVKERREWFGPPESLQRQIQQTPGLDKCIFTV
jgi:hypothetical protein